MDELARQDPRVAMVLHYIHVWPLSYVSKLLLFWSHLEWYHAVSPNLSAHYNIVDKA